MWRVTYRLLCPYTLREPSVWLKLRASVALRFLAVRVGPIQKKDNGPPSIATNGTASRANR